MSNGASEWSWFWEFLCVILCVLRASAVKNAQTDLITAEDAEDDAENSYTEICGIISALPGDGFARKVSC